MCIKRPFTSGITTDTLKLAVCVLRISRMSRTKKLRWLFMISVDNEFKMKWNWIVNPLFWHIFYAMQPNPTHRWQRGTPHTHRKPIKLIDNQHIAFDDDCHRKCSVLDRKIEIYGIKRVALLDDAISSAALLRSLSGFVNLAFLLE